MILSPFELKRDGSITYNGQRIMGTNMSSEGTATTVAALNLAHSLGMRDGIASGVTLEEAVREVQVQVRIAKASPGFHG